MAINDLVSKNGMAVGTETITGPNAATVYSSVIKDIRPNVHKKEKRFAVISAKKSVVAVGTVSVDLYGCDNEAGTDKFLLKADVINNLSNAVQAGLVDLNLYPAPFYFIGVQSTGNDANGTVTLKIMG